MSASRKNIFNLEEMKDASPNKSIAPDEIFQKFRTCAKYRKSISQSDIEETLERLNRLEAITDINEIFGAIQWRT